ncbi:hypothetical protein [Pontibacter diazotrophicus]|nr:hypothetical protein [Pontibacter diazotrophicus]
MPMINVWLYTNCSLIPLLADFFSTPGVKTVLEPAGISSQSNRGFPDAL